MFRISRLGGKKGFVITWAAGKSHKLMFLTLFLFSTVECTGENLILAGYYRLIHIIHKKTHHTKNYGETGFRQILIKFF
jgi:hypothetical protein